MLSRITTQVSVIVQEKEYDATIPVVFDGGKGQYLVKSARVTLYRSDGQVMTANLGIKKGDIVNLEGTKQTDRVVAYVSEVNGETYKVADVHEPVPYAVTEQNYTTPLFFPRIHRYFPVMQVNWRWIHAARNSYAVLSAACERDGFLLQPVDSPADDVTCYSLNSVNAAAYRDEIACCRLPYHCRRPSCNSLPA